MRPNYETVICTYNGELFIEEQLTSILEQDPPPASVWVSDDGSTDRTQSIVTRISKESPVPVYWVDGPSKGVSYNLLSALHRTTADYVFIADQDDIWLKGKTEIFAREMYTPEDKRSHTPHLIFSDSWVWDPKKNTQKSFWRMNRIEPDSVTTLSHAAFYNGIQGSSSCINRALIGTIKTHEDIAMHDWWIALTAVTIGNVTPINKPTMLYRQHGNNLVGTESFEASKVITFRSRVLRASRQMEAFWQCYRHTLSGNSLAFFSDFIKANKGGLAKRLLFLIKHKPRHKTLSRTIALWVGYLSK